jgi:hypothetical protein
MTSPASDSAPMEWRWGHRPNRTAPGGHNHTLRWFLKRQEVQRRRLLRMLTGKGPWPHPQLDKARQVLRTMSMMPTARKLAQRAGVCPQTAWLALREYKGYRDRK